MSNELKPILKTNTLKIPSITYENYMRYPGLLKRHNVPALKQATREYKLRIGGRKADVIERLVNYFNTNASALRIQTCFRSWISRYIVRLRGPAYMDKSICVNDTDFCSMEPLSEIESNYFFSFTVRR